MPSEQDSTNFDVNELAELASMGELTGAQQQQLLRALEKEPSARAAYIRAVAFETMLAEEFPVQASSQPAPLPIPTGLLSVSIWRPAAAFALIAALIIGLYGWSRKQTSRVPRAESEEKQAAILPGPIATITHVSEVPLAKGTRLSPGYFEIAVGRGGNHV